MLLLLSNHHRRRLRMPRATCVVDFLSAPALWRGALWFSTGIAILALVPVGPLTLSAPPPAAQQTGPPAPEAAQAGSPAPQAHKPSRP